MFGLINDLKDRGAVIFKCVFSTFLGPIGLSSF